MEACTLHPALGFLVLHKRIPHEAAAVIFRHQHGDAEIDAQYVRVVPRRQRIEGVYKTVFLPHLIPVLATELSQDSYAIVEEE